MYKSLLRLQGRLGNYIGNPEIMRRESRDGQSAGERNKSWMEWGEGKGLVRTTALHSPKAPATICLEMSCSDAREQ